MNDDEFEAFLKALEPQAKATRLGMFWRVFWWASAIMVALWLVSVLVSR